MNGKLAEYFNKQPRIGTLSTANREGLVDSAVFGSPRMTDEKIVVMALGKGRTLEYLQENPNAVYLIMEPGATLTDWKGIRVYLKMTECAASGETLEAFKRQLAAVAGEEAAAMVKAAVTFLVTEVRPLIDMGQGWEQSI